MYKEVYEVLLGFWNADKIELCEQLCVVPLTNRGSVLGIVELSTGGFTGVVVNTKMVFIVAYLKIKADVDALLKKELNGLLKPVAVENGLLHDQGMETSNKQWSMISNSKTSP